MPTTERDVSGGWYDAGDYNKYTNWTAEYVVDLLRAYRERPEIWTDDYDIPESGNGVPDILDEVKWGLDWLVKMQDDDGSLLSIVGLDHAQPAVGCGRTEPLRVAEHVRHAERGFCIRVRRQGVRRSRRCACGAYADGSRDSRRARLAVRGPESQSHLPQQRFGKRQPGARRRPARSRRRRPA